MDLVRRAPDAADAIKRFQFRASATDPWSSGPASSLEREDLVDVDLVALGIQPGRTYRARFLDTGSTGATSDEFEFQLCTESVTLRLDPRLAGEDLRLEAEATDRHGHHQIEPHGGTIHVAT